MARGIVPTLTCDYCHTVLAVNDVKDIPAGWYQVAVGCESDNGKVDKGKIDLCKLTCVEKWAKERRQVLAENAGNIKWKCPVCDDELGSQGKGSHLQKHADEGVINSHEASEIIRRSQVA